MKRLLSNLLALALLVAVLSACSGQQSEPLYYEDGIVNLHGPWEDQKGPATTEDDDSFQAMNDQVEATTQLAAK